ncbi:hypothetical protein ACE1CI_23405 [Aerosakkonemataceae cyanobacterium BLCC-F50]|uniref:Uncharacterized protein n=1 Tax=Floridaenema flaviceps BLCC-F50 TaxID=3153642 RepID=A0ABV4XW16_9CYAN
MIIPKFNQINLTLLSLSSVVMLFGISSNWMPTSFSFSQKTLAQNVPDKTRLEQQRAAEVIRHYYDAINRKDYKSAYADWAGRGAASGQSFEEFKKGFANTTSVKVNIGQPGSINGAAGSLYIEIPVNITATTVNRTTQRFAGNYTLKRINDVPGSTPEQRRWHLYSAKINPVS